MATRQASLAAIEGLSPLLPELFWWFGRPGLFQPDRVVRLQADARRHSDGNYINYGVREFGMSAIVNGIALHGGFIPSVPPS